MIANLHSCSDECNNFLETSLAPQLTQTRSSENCFCNAYLPTSEWFSPPLMLADMADKVMEVATPTFAAISDTRTNTSEVKQLHEEVARLADLVASRTTQSCCRSSSRPRRAHSPAPLNPPPEDSLCWYHAKFSEAAQKCKDPCSWENSQAGR